MIVRKFTPVRFGSSLNSERNEKNMSSQTGVPFLGSKITLISKTGIRYEGTLFNIDASNNSVALKDGTLPFHNDELIVDTDWTDILSFLQK